jgi:hypothetical protein
MTVKKALMNGAWMRGLKHMNSETELDQFIVLWEGGFKSRGSAVL